MLLAPILEQNQGDFALILEQKSCLFAPILEQSYIFALVNRFTLKYVWKRYNHRITALGRKRT